MKLLDSLGNLILEQTSSPIISREKIQSANQEAKLFVSCKSAWEPELPKAVDYWKKWLNNPITKEKFKKNWSADPKTNRVQGHNVEDIFRRYTSALDQLKLVYYDKSTKIVYGTNVDVSGDWAARAGAFVLKDYPTLIFINCKFDWPEKFATLVHEIQHTLYKIWPLNPDVKTQDVFVGKNTKKIGPSLFFPIQGATTISGSTSKPQTSTSYLKKPTAGLNWDELSNTNRIPKEYLIWWFNFANLKRPDPGYACRNNEKLSNIMAIRKLFNLQPGQDLTLEMLRPYIEVKKRDVDITWLLICWAQNNFLNIEEFLQNLNSLAYQKKPQTDTQLV